MTDFDDALHDLGRQATRLNEQLNEIVQRFVKANSTDDLISSLRMLELGQLTAEIEDFDRALRELLSSYSYMAYPPNKLAKLARVFARISRVFMRDLRTIDHGDISPDFVDVTWSVVRNVYALWECIYDLVMPEAVGDQSLAESATSSALPAVSVYVDTHEREKVEPILSALHDLFESEGLTLEPDGHPKISSWWGKFKIRTKDFLTREEIAARLQKIEHGVEVVGLRQPMSVENAKQAEAIAALTTAVENVSNAVILSGSVILVKWTESDGKANLYAKTLSVAEVREFEQNQHLLSNPTEALSRLHLLAEASRMEVQSADGPLE